jgi:tetratricopeptide (TPR) repeat protein
LKVVLTSWLCCVGIAFATSPARNPVDLRTSCNESVQADFNAAVTLLHHMTYPLARAAFAAITRKDPECAMARWGIAMTLFQPLWPNRPGKADLQLGWDTLHEGLALPSTARERAWLRATAAFFETPESAEYWPRVDRWQRALAALHGAYPDDDEVTAFYALSVLATARPGPEQAQHSAQAVAVLLPILQRHPDHPGAMHYIIHADDIPGREHDDSEVVRRYEQTAPDNPHALHMPTHIYTRLGDWDGVIRGNLRAAEAALKYPAGEHGEWIWDEYAHAIEYLVYAYLQKGADDAAQAQITRLLATPNLERTAKTAFHLASTRSRYALERQAWDEAAALTPRDPPGIDWDRNPWPEAIVVFARGYGAAKTGCGEDVARQRARLGALKERAESSGETVFTRQIRVLELELGAAASHCVHADADAVERLKEALRLEADTPKPAVTPAATLPAAELLGDLLLELDRPRDALAAYQRSLQMFPRRFNGEIGIVRARLALGDRPSATRAFCELQQWAKVDSRSAARTVQASLGPAANLETCASSQ